MPKVGNKHFSYSDKGKKAAKRHAKKTGQKVKYRGGGVIQGTPRVQTSGKNTRGDF